MTGIDLYARISGQPGRQPVVLLHGLFGSSANWGTVARRLSTRFHVLVPDLRNHGQSPHAPDASYAAMVDDVLRLCDRHGLTRVLLIGHSMGGKVAMHLALNHPQRVEGLAVVDIAPVRYTHDFEAVLAGFRAVDLAGIRSRSDADRTMAAHVPGSGVRAFLLQNLVKGEVGWTWRLNLDALAASQAEITGFPDQAPDTRFSGPCSFIYGVQSDYVTGAYEPVIRRYFPDAVLCPVADAGHWVYADQPQAFMASLGAFLPDRGRAG